MIKPWADKAPAGKATADKTTENDKSPQADTEAPSNGLIEAGPPVENPSTFSRAKGTLFLVSRGSRAVIWSTYARPRDRSADTLDKTADEIVNRLKRDLLKPDLKDTK